MELKANVERIKKRKKELKWSNKRLADEAGIPVGTVNKILSGVTRYPRDKTMEAMAGAMGMGSMEARAALGMSVAREGLGYYGIRKNAPVTIDTFYSLPKELRGELIDGVVQYHMEPRIDHQMIMTELIVRIKNYLNYRKLDNPLGIFPCGVRLDCDEYTILKPDLFIMPSGAKPSYERFFDGVPEVVIEITTLEEEDLDYEVKRQKYFEAGVSEYWVIDSARLLATVYHLDRDDRMRMYDYEDEIESKVFQGLRIDMMALAKSLRG